MTALISSTRPVIALAATVLCTACGDAPVPVAPRTPPSGASLSAANAATRIQFTETLPDFVGQTFFECIGEVVTIHNIGVALDWTIAMTKSGITNVKALIYWPENSLFAERSNGVRYYQPENARALWHEHLGNGRHTATLVDPYHLRSAAGEMLKFQRHIRFEFGEGGQLLDIQITGSCPHD